MFVYIVQPADSFLGYPDPDSEINRIVTIRTLLNACEYTDTFQGVEFTAAECCFGFF